MYKKKSLGQHFLTSAAYVCAVADAAAIQKTDTVLEIGPGEGVLTRELLLRAARVVAVEKDHRLIPYLHETFAREIAEKKFSIVEADALQIESFAELTPYKVVANIPYYITGALLRKFLASDAQPTTLVFLIQKEVALRIARSKKESLLSLSVKAYGAAKYVREVPRGAFAPAPTVDSAILLVTDISRNNFINQAHEDKFFALIHAGFAQKRKLLKRNLEIVLGLEIRQSMEYAGIPENARAEDVPIEKWLMLARG